MIKFKYGLNKPQVTTTQLSQKAENKMSQTKETAQVYTTEAEFFQLPKKYARKQLSADEIDAINVIFLFVAYSIF